MVNLWPKIALRLLHLLKVMKAAEPSVVRTGAVVRLEVVVSVLP